VELRRVAVIGWFALFEFTLSSKLTSLWVESSKVVSYKSDHLRVGLSFS